MRRKILLVVFVLFQVSARPVPAQVNAWKSFTSVGTIRDILVDSENAWAVSNGGVFQLRLADESVSSITNTDGLSANDVVAVAKDRSGALWFALFNGVLNRYDPEAGEWEVIEDYENQTITDIVAFGDSLYIGLDFGVSLYNIAKREVKETYVNLGLSTGDNIEKIGANAVFIDGLDIWVATDKGLAQSSLDLPNLQAPASWKQYRASDGLPSNFVNDIVVLDGIPYAATRFGVARFVGGVWQVAGFGLATDDVLGLEVAKANQFFSQNTVVAYTASGVFWLDSSDRWARLGPALGDVSSLGTGEDGTVWVGRKNKGLARFDFEQATWRLFEQNAPASNNFKSLALDSKGRLWCASQAAGVHMWDGEKWTNFSKSNGLSGNDQRTVVVDADDRVWVGSWGGGISIFEETENGFRITRIDTAGGILAGSVTPTFVLVNGMIVDQMQNIWVLNRQANNSRVLAVHTPEGQWIHFSTNEGLFTPFVQALTIDRSGRVWIGTEDRGIRVLDHRGTLADKSDDDFSQGLDISDGLISNKITAITEDEDGVVWIGTEEGVNFWFQGKVGRQFGLINDFVNTIGVDPRNNKWFGTANGVSVLSTDGVSFTHYTTGNSPLVSDNVLSLAFNAETGEVWIGTTNGLSRLQTPFTAPKEDLSQLTGFPNPFIVDGSAVFTVTNLAENTSVKIYDVAGSLVRTFRPFDDIIGGQVLWDGRDEDGKLVASGIYVYLAFTDSGISATGKVAVIRK